MNIRGEIEEKVNGFVKQSGIKSQVGDRCRSIQVSPQLSLSMLPSECTDIWDNNPRQIES